MTVYMHWFSDSSYIFGDPERVAENAEATERAAEKLAELRQRAERGVV